VPLVAEDASDTISSSASSVSERSSEAVSPFELTVRVNGSSLSGVLRLFDLGNELPDGTLIYATLTCENGAGLTSVLTSEPFHLVSAPTVAPLSVLPPWRWSEPLDAWVGKPGDAIELSWDRDLVAVKPSYSVCIGRAPEVCAYEKEFAAIDLQSELGAMLGDAAYASKSSVELYVALSATDGRSRSVETHTRLILDKTPPAMGVVTVEGVMLGARELNGTAVLRKARVTLGVRGGVHDADVEYEMDANANSANSTTAYDLTVKWSARAGNGSEIECLFAHNGLWQWAAACDGFSGGLLCFTAFALNAAGLSSSSSSDCIFVDDSVPKWTSTPTLTRDLDDAELLQLEWDTPIEPPSGPLRIDWALCTLLACAQPVVAMANASAAPISGNHPLLRNYTGMYRLFRAGGWQWCYVGVLHSSTYCMWYYL
jgi:hypothetical protein